MNAKFIKYYTIGIFVGVIIFCTIIAINFVKPKDNQSTTENIIHFNEKYNITHDNIFRYMPLITHPNTFDMRLNFKKHYGTSYKFKNPIIEFFLINQPDGTYCIEYAVYYPVQDAHGFAYIYRRNLADDYDISNFMIHLDENGFYFPDIITPIL